MLKKLIDNDVVIRNHYKADNGLIVVDDKSGYDKYITDKMRIEKVNADMISIKSELEEIKKLILNMSGKNQVQ